MQKRTTSKKIMMSIDEKSAIEKRVPYGTDFSNWARATLLGKTVQSKKLPTTDPKLLSAINKVGTNLNQIARRANSEELNVVGQEILIQLAKNQEYMAKILKYVARSHTETTKNPVSREPENTSTEYSQQDFRSSRRLPENPSIGHSVDS